MFESMNCSTIAVLILFAAAPLRAEGNFSVTVFRAKPGYLLQAGKHQPALDLIAEVPWLNPATSQLESPVAAKSTGSFPVLDLADPDVPGGDGTFASSTSPFPGDRPSTDDDHFAVLAEGTLRIPRAGSWSFIVGHADTFSFTLDGRSADEDGRSLTGVCCHGTAPIFTFRLSAGDVPLVLRYGASTGPAYLELFAAEGPAVAFEPDGPYHLVGDVLNGGLEVIPSTPCDDPPEVAQIDGAGGPVVAGQPVTLDGSNSQAGGPGPLGFKWSIVSGRGAIEGSDDGPTVTIRSIAEGPTTVKLVVDDGVCSNPGSAEVVLDFRVVNPANWKVTYYKPVPGYHLDHEDHQPVRDLIANVPWRDPTSGDLVSPIAYTVTVNSPVIDYLDPDAPGPGGIFPYSSPFPEGQAEEDEDQFALMATGTVRIPVDGFYSFIVGHDDTFEFTLNGESVDMNGVPTNSGCCETKKPVFSFQLPAGDLPVTLSYGESDGGAFLEFFASVGLNEPYRADGFYRLVGDKGRGGLEVLAPCQDAPEVASILAPPGPLQIGVPFTLDGSGSSAGGGEVRPLTFHWAVLSGPGTIVGPDDASTVELVAQTAGRTLVKLTVDDGVCEDPTSTQLSVVVGSPPTWIRGDSNGDLVVDISDAVSTLQFLFSGATPPDCRPALDSNVDGEVDISDPVSDLGVLFLGVPAPASWEKCEPLEGCAVNCP